MSEEWKKVACFLHYAHLSTNSKRMKAGAVFKVSPSSVYPCSIQTGRGICCRRGIGVKRLLFVFNNIVGTYYQPYIIKALVYEKGKESASLRKLSWVMWLINGQTTFKASYLGLTPPT